MFATNGLFIALEGIDFTGKTTQREFIAETFRDAGFEVIITREPGGTPQAERIRDLLLTPHQEDLTPIAEVLLFFAAREQHLATLIRPALARGAVVITDRFVDSTYAYQAAGGGVSEAWINDLSEMVVADHQPDMTFLLTMDPQQAKLRANARGALDRMEDKADEYYVKAQQAFIYRALQAKHRYKIVEAGGDIESVRAQILSKCNLLIHQLRKSRAKQKDAS